MSQNPCPIGTSTSKSANLYLPAAIRQATPRQHKFAIWICILISSATIFLMPVAQTSWSHVPAFIPAYQTAIIGAYLITAYLMYAHYQATHLQALLHLSAGCVYTAVVLIMQFLSFPGMFFSNGRLLGESQTTIWLWCFWHAGPAIGALLYAWSEYRRPAYVTPNPTQAVWQTGILLALALVGTGLMVTVFHDWLPVLDKNGDFSKITSSGIAPGLQIILIIALFMLWKASRFRNTLHVWVGITLVALLCDNAITMSGGNRLSVGWYVGRFNALISSLVIMITYLQDVKRSYEQIIVIANELATSNAVLEARVDQERLDALTKLPRRELLIEQAESLRAKSVTANMGFATLFIDLDGFKKINDFFGHDHGDYVLVRVADALKSMLRNDDVVGRIGGDEFIVCLTAPKEQILKLAAMISERIIDKLGQLNEDMGASVGISVCNRDMTSALREADQAMYESKKLGKNQFRLFQNKLHLVHSV